MRTFTMLFVAVVTASCSNYAIKRADAYRAFPLSYEESQELKEYNIIIFQPNYILLKAEEGSAWQVLLQQNGEIKKHFAVLSVNNENQALLLSIIPGDLKELTGGYAILVSHDGKYCFNAKADMFSCSDIEQFDWEKNAIPLIEGDEIKVVEIGSSEDSEIKKWLNNTFSSEMAKEFNTTIPEEKEFRNLLSERWGNRFLKELVFASVFFGEMFLITGEPKIALGSVAIMETFRLFDLIGLIASPDFNHPEYGSGNVDRWTLAGEVYRLEARLKWLEKKLGKEE